MSSFDPISELGLSEPQLLSIAESNHRVNVWEGAIRSGKTFSSELRWLMFLADPPKGGDFVMVGRTRDSIARNVIHPMQNPDVFGPLADTVKYTTGAPFANIMGRRVYVMGASDSKAEKTIRGMTVAGAYVDEGTILAEEFFTQLLGRMSVPNAQLFLTTNPDNPAHWLKRKFLDRIGIENGAIEGWARWHFTLDDNPILTEEYKNSIKSEFTGLFYKRFVLGLWVAAEGSVYDMFDEERHIVDDKDMPRIMHYYSIGVDYGTTNPTAAVLLGLGEDNRLYAVDEWVYAPSSREVRKTDAQLAAGLLQWRGIKHDERNDNANSAPLVVDPAAASFHVQLLHEGERAFHAENDVLYGIRTVSSLLATDNLRINSRCHGLLEEFPGYSWDSKKTDEGQDQVVKKYDHCLVPETLVTTTTGDVPIVDVRPGDMVLTRAGWRRVLDQWKVSDSTPVMTVTTVNGATITGTPNHRVWTQNRGWQRIDALRPGDMLVTCNSQQFDTTGPHAAATSPESPSDRLASVTAENEPRPVYDLTVDGEHEFFANGVLVHNSLDALRYAVATTEKSWRRDINLTSI